MEVKINSTHLVRDHNQRVLVLREKIKQAPKSKSILLWQNSAAGSVRVVIFLCCKSPTELVYVLLNKGSFNNLQQHQAEIEASVKALEKKRTVVILSPYPGCIC